MVLTKQPEDHFYSSRFAQLAGYIAAAYTTVVLAVITARATSHRIENYGELEETVREEQFRLHCFTPIIPLFGPNTYVRHRKEGKYELNIAGSDPQELAVRSQVQEICRRENDLSYGTF